MSQDEVLRYLKKTKRWTGIGEISEHVDIGRNAITHNIKCLLKTGFIEEKFIHYSRRFYRVKKR